MKGSAVTNEEEPKVKPGFWNGVKHTAGKLWETVKANPGKALLATAALAFPPVGTAIGATVIAATIAKKSYETYQEQHGKSPKAVGADKAPAKVKPGFWNGIKRTVGKLWETVKANPGKALLATAALAFPPVGTAIGATVIAATIAKKSYETYQEQKMQTATPVVSHQTSLSRRSNVVSVERQTVIGAPDNTPDVRRPIITQSKHI
jgi:hypothetical protein